MKVFLFCLALTAHGFPMEGEEPMAEPLTGVDHIISYEDKEAGHGHVQTGVAGENVEGSLFYKVPEGETVHLTYKADHNGFVAAGDHLPVAPEPLPVEALVHPVMVENTPEVADAREMFEATFKEVQMRNAAIEETMMESVDNAIDTAIVEVIEERRRRDAEPVVIPEPEPSTYMIPGPQPSTYMLPHQPSILPYQYNMHYQPYAPTYPHVYYTYPMAPQAAVKAIEQVGDEDMEAAVAEPEPMAMGAPLVQLPFRTFSSPILTYPSLAYNPYNTLRIAPPSAVLPSLPQEGEDEPAALRL